MENLKMKLGIGSLLFLAIVGLTGVGLLYVQSQKKITTGGQRADQAAEIAPVSIGNVAGAATSSAQQAPDLKGKLLNGTSVVGLTSKVEKLVKGKLLNLEIIGKDNAKSKNHEKTLVVDLTGRFPKEASELAKFVSGEVSPLPAGEESIAGIDLLVIVGKDYLSK